MTCDSAHIMMGSAEPICTGVVVFVWWCLAASLTLHRSGATQPEGLDRNSTNTSHPPEPASDFRCFSFNFLWTTCEWTRGGLGDDVPSDDVLMSRWISGRQTWEECLYTRRMNCSGTRCQQHCSSCTVCDYRVQTTDVWGRTAHTAAVRFDVRTDSKLKPPRDVTVTNQSVSVLLVKWAPPEHNPQHIQYTLQYRWEGSADDSWTPRENIDGNEAQVKDLVYPYGRYYVRVKAERTLRPAVESAFTETAEGRTTESVPIDVPDDFLCADSQNPDNDTRHVHLSWKPLRNEYKLNGELRGYVITYTSSEAGPPVRLETGVNATNYTVYDLRKDHHYSFSIQARNSMGTSSRKEPCQRINPVPVEPPPVGRIVGVCIAVLVLSIVLTVVGCRVKNSIRTFPDIVLPSQLQADNEYLPEHRNPGTAREAEVFDDLKPCRLFVDLGPKQTDVIDIFDQVPVVTDGFDIGDKPRGRGAVGFQDDVIDLASLPLLGLRDELTPEEPASAADPLLPGSRRDEGPSSGDEYGGGGALPSSPLSVGSGGSYLDDEEMVYSRMTTGGLSPVEKENVDGRRVLGEGPQDAAPRACVDGLPLLLWRRESADSGSDEPQDGGAVDAYTKMSARPSRTGAGAAAGPTRGDPPGDQPCSSRGGATHSKGAKQSEASSKAGRGEGGADPAGAAYAGDGSVSDYVQQGFVPGPASHGDGDYDQGDPADSYSQLGLTGVPGAGSSPPDSGSRDRRTPAEPTVGREQRTEDSSTPLPGEASSAAGAAAAPIGRPGAEPNPSGRQPGIPNIAGAQSTDSLSDDDDDDEEGGLHYVTVAAALESSDDEEESAAVNQPADLNRYVTQAMLPNGLDAQTARAAPGDAAASNPAPSGYVDQSQLSNLSPPPVARSPPRANDPVQMNGTAGRGGSGGYVTAAEAQDIMSPGPDAAGPGNERFTNNNNSSGGDPGTESAYYNCGLGSAGETRAPRPDGDRGGPVPTLPTGSGYVTTDQLPSLPLPRPRANGRATGHPVDPESPDYVMHDEMLHMAPASGGQSAKSANLESGERTDLSSS